MFGSGKITGDILLEEIMWRNMTNNEKIQKMLEYISKLGVVGKDLVIIDSYFFPEEGKYDNDYINLVTNVLSRAGVSSVKIVTHPQYNRRLYNIIRNNLSSVGLKLTLVTSHEFHDRFWICPDVKQGFVLGTTLNGFGKKICLIQGLEYEDTEDLINAYHQILGV